MRKREIICLGAVAAAGAVWGARLWRRHARKIDLAGRVVVITGGSTGHGLILGRMIANQGGHIVVASRTTDELEAARNALLEEGAASAMAVPTDVRDQEQAQTLIDKTIDHYGRIDILINNAATIGVGPFEAMTLDDFEDAMRTIYWGAVYTTMAALPHMRGQGFGRIGNVVSMGGKLGAPHLMPYVTGKFALAGFTQAMRTELAKDNIFVTGVYPVAMRTGGHTHALMKGDHEAEYQWFGTGDTTPGLSVSAENVARKFLDAIRHGDAEVIVDWPSYLLLALQGILPNEVAELLAGGDRLLPRYDGPPNEAIAGADIQTPNAKRINRAIPEGARP